MATEDADLRRLFGDWNIEEELSNLPEWNIDTKAVGGNGRIQEYRLSSEDVRFGFNTHNDVAFLNWSARIPEHLTPDKSTERFEEFLSFIHNDFPPLFYDPSGYRERSKSHLDNSIIGLSPDRTFTDSKFYHPSIEEERDALLDEFTSNPEGIKFIQVSLGEDLGDNSRACGLYITYPESPKDRGVLTIWLPVNSTGIKGWTERVTEWAIETNVDRYTIKDVGKSASTLSQTLLAIAGEAYNARFSPISPSQS